MKYIIFILSLFLLSCKPSYVFKESPCPTFDKQFKKDKKKSKKAIPVEKKEVLNPKFK